MSGPDFLDSNVLVYSYDASDGRKQKIAQKLVSAALDGDAVISAQVLAELAVALLYRVVPKATPERVTAILDAVSPIKAVQPDAGMVRRAVEVRERYGVHFYDGMIIAAAERGGCGRIWSEDLNPGQTYFEIAVHNPFA